MYAVSPEDDSFAQRSQLQAAFHHFVGLGLHACSVSTPCFPMACSLTECS